MKALTLRPAWAWAVIHGGKFVENRSWYTTHRGPLVIHAGSPGPRDADDVAEVERILGRAMPDEIDFGAAIGVVDLVDVLQPSQACARYPDGPKWARGPYCWLLANPIAVVPVDWRGRLGLWEFPASELAMIPDRNLKGRPMPETHTFKFALGARVGLVGTPIEGVVVACTREIDGDTFRVMYRIGKMSRFATYPEEDLAEIC